METEWKHIVKKANAISIGKGFDIKNILLGALLPCIITNIAEAFDKQPISLWPTAICAVVYVGYEVLCTFFPRLKTDNISENKVNLQDLQDAITEIQTRFNSQE